MLTLNKAKQLALESLLEKTGLPLDTLLILDALTECRRAGWIFYYEARAYLQTGDAAHAFGETGPVVVTHHGRVHHLRGDRPAAAVLRDFERRRATP
jgi:hypothetical protein